MVEKQFGLLCHTLGSITRKTARLRDKGDLLSKQLLKYCESETISHSSKVGVVHFAESIAAIQDYRQAEVQRLDAKVVTPLSTYGSKCKEIKNGIKNEMKALSKERKMAGKLDKVRQKTPGDARLIVSLILIYILLICVLTC
ncbi:hypothetical protein ACJMK2_010805 [Sinanodonta woodiana]|uniref:Uncharacterized protein n=1 Tax=Sinanodonta woodiana TaxID=1069815 RepID=A0ABD3VGM1_SINWO